MYAEREAELAEEMAAIEVQSVAASETGDMEKEYLQLELAKSRASFSDQEQLLASYEVWVFNMMYSHLYVYTHVYIHV